MRVDRVEHPGEEWDRFAEGHPDGRLGHASVWADVLETAYDLEPHFFAARSGEGDLAGLLPLAAFRSRPGGRPRLISLPFLDSAGILASDAGTEAALRDHALAYAAEGGFGSLELRGFSTDPPTSEADLRMDRVNLVLPLEATEESQWTALSAKVRNQCRKAEREGLTLRTGDCESLREDFLAPYRVNMRDLGSPPHSAAFFEALSRRFGDRLRFVVTEHAGRPVGGLVAIRFGRRVYVPWASTLRTERNRCPNNQIYWEAIRWAVRTGAAELDFGRSPIDGGTYRFKKGWGAHEEPLVWRTLAPNGTTTLQRAGTDDSLVKKLSELWTKLPVSFASAVGSQLRRYFAN